MQAANRNLLWAQVVVDELARSGLRAVCIAPGSRSTPLTVAFAEHPDINVYSLIDERSASFFALGLALASKQPVAVLCSSGTATANFHPAIIEAYYAGVPLLVLTADRPHELRESGANQTIDQVKMYGDHVLWSVDVALPESDPAPVALRNLRTLACRAYALADGLRQGPVHLNFPFRKPLEPTPVPTDITAKPEFAGRDDGRPFTTFSQNYRMLNSDAYRSLLPIMRESPRGLIICGQGCPRHLHSAVAHLASAAEFPLIADPLSGTRFGRYVASDALTIGGYDSFLDSTWDSPDIILHFGKMPASKALDDYLSRVNPKWRVLVSETGQWTDAHHLFDQVVIADPMWLCSQLASQLDAKKRSVPRDAAWNERLASAEAIVWQAIDAVNDADYFDGLVLADVVDLLPPESLLYVGNSLPVRHLEQFARPTDKSLRVFANRGASGIDGVVSSALGAAAASDRPLTLVIGDLSFYHDMNGLLAIKRCGVKATIVLLNNDGGGIFTRLPIANFEPPFTDLFRTPHGLDFEPAIRMYGLDYARADDRPAFRSNFAAALQSDTATVIEVPTDVNQDQARRRALMDKIQQRINSRERN